MVMYNPCRLYSGSDVTYIALAICWTHITIFYGQNAVNRAQFLSYDLNHYISPFFECVQSTGIVCGAH